MLNTKSVLNATLKKKINGYIYELMLKTTANATYMQNGKTLEETIKIVNEDIEACKKSINELIIGGGQPGIDLDKLNEEIEKTINNALSDVTDTSNAESLASKIISLQDTVDELMRDKDIILEQANLYTDQKIGLNGTTYSNVKEYVDSVKDEINRDSSAFHFAGKVDYEDQLPLDAKNGDVYQVRFEGTSLEGGDIRKDSEYAFNGSEFVELGPFINLEKYSTTEEITDAINVAKNEMENYTSSQVTTVQSNTNKQIEDVKKISANKSRFLLSEDQPDDMSDNDLWAAIIDN